MKTPSGLPAPSGGLNKAGIISNTLPYRASHDIFAPLFAKRFIPTRIIVECVFVSKPYTRHNPSCPPVFFHAHAVCRSRLSKRLACRRVNYNRRKKLYCHHNTPISCAQYDISNCLVFDRKMAILLNFVFLAPLAMRFLSRKGCRRLRREYLTIWLSIACLLTRHPRAPYKPGI